MPDIAKVKFNLVESPSGKILKPVTIRFSDWFLPSKDETQLMRDNLHALGVGNFCVTGTFQARSYWTSSQYGPTVATIYTFYNNYMSYDLKFGMNGKARPMRVFTTADIYALRSMGPARGWIFNIINNGNGTYTYYEACGFDLFIFAWSNVMTSVTTSDAVGTGQANTTAIINQAGHTGSAAKLCDDLVVEV